MTIKLHEPKTDEGQFTDAEMLEHFADAVEAFTIHGDTDLTLWVAKARLQAAMSKGDTEEAEHQLAFMVEHGHKASKLINAYLSKQMDSPQLETPETQNRFCKSAGAPVLSDSMSVGVVAHALMNDAAGKIDLTHFAKVDSVHKGAIIVGAEKQEGLNTPRTLEGPINFPVGDSIGLMLPASVTLPPKTTVTAAGISPALHKCYDLKPRETAVAATTYSPGFSSTPFDDYEVHGCKEFKHPAGDYTEQVPDEEATFFSLYGHRLGEGVECIADYETREIAEHFMRSIRGAAVQGAQLVDAMLNGASGNQEHMDEMSAWIDRWIA